jgi:hypothetical protein
MTAVSSSEQQQVGAGSADVGSNGAVLAATLWKATSGNTQCVGFKKVSQRDPDLSNNLYHFALEFGNGDGK